MSIQAVSDVIDHAEAKGNELLLLIILSNYVDDHRLCWPSIKTISKETRMTRRTTQRTILRVHQYNRSNELCVITQGAKMYNRAANSKYSKRCNLYSILTGLPSLTKTHRKVWSNQQFFVQKFEGVNSGNMTPFHSPRYDDLIGEYELMIAWLIKNQWHLKGDINHAKGDIAATPNPLKNPLFNYITTSYIYSQDNRLRDYH